MLRRNSPVVKSVESILVCSVGLRISSAGNLITILTNFGDIRHLVPG